LKPKVILVIASSNSDVQKKVFPQLKLVSEEEDQPRKDKHVEISSPSFQLEEEFEEEEETT